MAAGPESYDAFYKATWNAAWQAPHIMRLAQADAARQAAGTAPLDHARRSLECDADNLNARNPSIVLTLFARYIATTKRAPAGTKTRAMDPLDQWSRMMAVGERPRLTSECFSTLSST